MTDFRSDAAKPFFRRRLPLALAGVGLLAIGGVAGTVTGHAFQPPIEMAPLHPVTIRSLPTAPGIVTIRGRVAETYGNKFVIDDGSARTLVDTGHEGDETRLVSDGASVTVQGRFERGFVHASFLVDQAGKVTALGPVGGPPHGHHGPEGRDGPMHGMGPMGPGGPGDGGPGARPMPPQDGAAPPPPPAA